MGGKFKEYDKKYAHCKRTDTMESAHMQVVARSQQCWPLEVLQWTQVLVQGAVYEAPGFEEWQKFRVSLKGQSTGMKLVRLQQYLVENNVTEIARCRVDNYIGALVRGGQLDSKLRIVR